MNPNDHTFLGDCTVYLIDVLTCFGLEDMER